MVWHRLVAHPASDDRNVRSLQASAGWQAGGLGVGFHLEGQLAGLRVPEFAGVAPGHELWRHTCFELFARRPDERRYWELNLAPSGAWTAFRLDGYRQGYAALEPSAPPRMTWRRSPDRLELEAWLQLPDLADGQALELGLCAVVEAQAGGLSHWALAHAGPRPDFHDPRGFVLHLA